MTETTTGASMEYRQDTPEQHGYENDSEELMGTRDQVQQLMSHSDPEYICDMLLVLANICEHRCLMTGPGFEIAKWYSAVQSLARFALRTLDTIPNGPRPSIKLENQMLYWPDFEKMH